MLSLRWFRYTEEAAHVLRSGRCPPPRIRSRPLVCEQLEDRNLPSFIVQSPIISADQNPAAEAVADFFSHGQSDLAVTNGNLGQPNGTVAIYENTTTSSGGDITF